MSNRHGAKRPLGVASLSIARLCPLLLMVCCASTLQAQRNTLAPGVYVRTMMIDGVTRQYRVYVPKDVEKPTGLPLVVLLHGLGADGETVAKATEMDKQSTVEGYMLVCPDAGGPDKRWNPGVPDADKGLLDDTKFLSRLVAVLKSTIQTDPRRIYMAGYSSGATMTYKMALTIPDELAAVVAVTSTPEAIWMKDLRKLQPVPLMIVAGEDDKHTPYKKQPKPPISRMTVKDTIDAWVRINKCKTPPSIREAEDGGVTIEEYSGASPLSRVTLLTVHRSEHDWPGTTIKQRSERPALHGIVQDEIWRFCRRMVR